jgi:hypothetical protein
VATGRRRRPHCLCKLVRAIQPIDRKGDVFMEE